MRETGQGSRLFLTELIISLSLFVISAAVCVALLVHARGMSLESNRLTQAVYMAQSAAEAWRAGEPAAQPASNEDELTLSLQESEGRLDVAVYHGSTLIYSLEGVERRG